MIRKENVLVMGRSSARRPRWRLLPAALALAVVLALGGPGSVGATTGPDTPTPARYKVPLRLAQPFRGQYSLVSAARGARISGGAMAIDLNSLNYLFGIMQLRGYDARGQVTTTVVGLYNFHFAAHGQMLATIYDTADIVALGSMDVARKANGDLAGQITLGHQRAAVYWHKNVSL